MDPYKRAMGEPISFEQLGANTHLDREKALDYLQKRLAQAGEWAPHARTTPLAARAPGPPPTAWCMITGDPLQVDEAIEGIKLLLAEEAWEKKLGGLLACKVRTEGSGRDAAPCMHAATRQATPPTRCAHTCLHVHACNARAMQVVLESERGGEPFQQLVLSEALRLLEDDEVRRAPQALLHAPQKAPSPPQHTRVHSTPETTRIAGACGPKLAQKFTAARGLLGQGASLPGKVLKRGWGLGCALTCPAAANNRPKHWRERATHAAHHTHRNLIAPSLHSLAPGPRAPGSGRMHGRAGGTGRHPRVAGLPGARAHQHLHPLCE